MESYKSIAQVEHGSAVLEESHSELELATVAKLRRIASGAEESIEQDIRDTDNNWMAAYRNKFIAIRGNLGIFLTREPEARTKYEGAFVKLAAAENLMAQLVPKYKEKADMPTDDEKSILLGNLDIV